MDIGHKILMLRKQHNITQEKLAAEMGVSIAAVSKWETKNSMPDIMMLCALADFFEVTTDELLGRNKMGEFLICDDARVVREALCHIIAKTGCSKIIFTENGCQLLAALEKKSPDVVFLDLHLPDADGLELLRQIKARDGKIKVVVITADASEQTKNRAVEAGADAYVTKPFLPEQIELVLSTLQTEIM